MKSAFTIDLCGASSNEEIHRRIAKALPLPPEYGHNLDALYDVLTEYGGSWRIEFKNAGCLGEGFRAVFKDAIADTPGLEIVFDSEGASTKNLTAARGLGRRLVKRAKSK